MSEDHRVLNEKLIRRNIIRVCDAAKVAGGCLGRMLHNLLLNDHPAPDDALHVMGLCQDLIGSGHITRKDIRRYPDERMTLDNQIYAITSKGTALLAEAIEPDPLVWDRRVQN